MMVKAETTAGPQEFIELLHRLLTWLVAAACSLSVLWRTCNIWPGTEPTRERRGSTIAGEGRSLGTSWSGYRSEPGRPPIDNNSVPRPAGANASLRDDAAPGRERAASC